MKARLPFRFTLALLKPDLYANPVVVDRVLVAISANSLEVVARRDGIVFDEASAGAFYKEHQGKFYFNRLVSYMTSGPFAALALRSTEPDTDAITQWRALIGPTHPVRAKIRQPQSLRALYGLTDTRNSFHGSDSPESATRELKFFFPDLNTEKQ
ncbi:hypothetical protein RI367_003975 [Sorochytrium milnesiophthora]